MANDCFLEKEKKKKKVFEIFVSASEWILRAESEHFKLTWATQGVITASGDTPNISDIFLKNICEISSVRINV